MAEAKRTEVFNVDINKFYETIVDYKSYPEFVDGVDKIEVLSQDEKGAKVKYCLNLIKEFTYIISLKHEKPYKVTWTLESGDLFKKNDGGWELKDLGGGKTEATYTLGVDFKMFAPSMIVNKLVANNLPTMMKAFADRAAKK